MPDSVHQDEAAAAASTSPMLTTADVAHLLRISREVVYQRIARAQLPGVVRVGRKILIRRDRVMRWLSKERVT